MKSVVARVEVKSLLSSPFKATMIWQERKIDSALLDTISAFFQLWNDNLIGSKLSADPSAFTIFRFMRDCWNIVENNMGVDEKRPENNIAAYSRLTGRKQPLLNIEALKKQKNLLSFSGGKESTMLKMILDHFDIPYELHNTQVWSNGIDQNALTTFEPGLYWHKCAMPGPNAFFHKLLVVAYANNEFDNILFGSELERQTSYFNTVTGLTNPTHTIVQNQQTYNLLAALPEVKTHIYAGVMNFSQIGIVQFLLRNHCSFNSCELTKNKTWCNKCDKCPRIGFMCESLDKDYRQIPFLKDLQSKNYRDNLYDLLSVEKPRSNEVAVEQSIQSYLDRLETEDWKQIKHYVKDLSCNVWDEESLTRIIDYVNGN